MTWCHVCLTTFHESESRVSLQLSLCIVYYGDGASPMRGIATSSFCTKKRHKKHMPKIPSNVIIILGLVLALVVPFTDRMLGTRPRWCPSLHRKLGQVSPLQRKRGALGTPGTVWGWEGDTKALISLMHRTMFSAKDPQQGLKNPIDTYETAWDCMHSDAGFCVVYCFAG